MQFPTITFAVFFLIVFALAWLARPFPRAWKLVLLAASWTFYAWWDWRFVLLLAGSIALNHLFAGAVARQGRVALPAGIAANLLVLGVFKYFGFFSAAFASALNRLGFSLDVAFLDVVLPVGISFYTFEAIAYLIEIRRGLAERLRLLDLATYLSFFPKLTSGPITRPSEFHPQLSSRPSSRRIEASLAFWLLSRGLAKKMIVATFLADSIVTGIFSTPGQFSSVEVLVGIYAYAAELYLDFSGYTDMALGLGLLLGFRLPENFDRPYSALTVTSFWGRWHMSLTRWLRDFLFDPLARRSSRTTLATARILMVVMLLMGLWHGAAFTFILWGAIHGAAMALERVYRLSRRKRRLPPLPESRLGKAARWTITFHFVAFAWVFFRADSVATAFDVLARLGAPGPAPAVTPALVVVLALVLASQLVPDDWSTRLRGAFVRSRPVLQAGALGLVLLIVDSLGPAGVPSFIYFGF